MRRGLGESAGRAERRAQFDAIGAFGGGDARAERVLHRDFQEGMSRGMMIGILPVMLGGMMRRSVHTE